MIFSSLIDACLCIGERDKNENNLKISILLSYMSMFVSIIVSMLYTPFMLRHLGQQQYGLYNMAASVISYLNLFDLGLGNAVVRYATKYRIERNIKMQNTYMVCL